MIHISQCKKNLEKQFFYSKQLTTETERSVWQEKLHENKKSERNYEPMQRIKPAWPWAEPQKATASTHTH